MVRILFGVVIVLHGLVHLLYFGQSARYFELQPGMTWPTPTGAVSPMAGRSRFRFQQARCPTKMSRLKNIMKQGFP